MRQIVLIVGVENQEALETAAWYLKRGDAVYAGVTNGAEALKERLEETYPGLHVNQLDLGTEEPAALAEQIMQAEKKLDVLVLQAGGRAEHDGEIGCENGKYHDYDDMLRVLDYNINGMRQVIEQSIPLLSLGEKKRIAVITESSSSVGWTRETDAFAYRMSLAAIHMMEKIYFNRLRPEGFTFRCYAAEGKGGISGAEYIEQGLCYDEKEPYIHSDENRLVMRNRYLQEIPW